MDGNFGQNNPENRVEQKLRKPKWFKITVGAFLALFLLISGSVAWRAISLKRGISQIDKLAESLKQAQEKSLAEQLADTYGGKTPQETLQMYISAVEKGDYELASKYFTLENREKELKSFHDAQNVSGEKISKYLSILNDSLKIGGKYSEDQKYFSFNGTVLIRMILYPNGMWKIIEI